MTEMMTQAFVRHFLRGYTEGTWDVQPGETETEKSHDSHVQVHEGKLKESVQDCFPQL